MSIALLPWDPRRARTYCIGWSGRAHTPSDRAGPALRDSPAIREEALPDDWATLHTCSLLGGSLLGQGEHAEAEPLLIQGYEGMKARETKIPESGKPRLPEAAWREKR